MESFNIKVIPNNYIFTIIGDEEKDGDLEWTPNPSVGVAEGAVAVGIGSLEIGETISATIKISQTYEKLPDAFLEHRMLVSSDGIEIVDVVESEREGREGYVGLIYDLPWSGWTTLQFRAPKGFRLNIEGDIEGDKEPKELEVLITPQN